MTVIDKIIGIAMAIFIYMFLGVTVMALKSDQNIENFANDKVNEFVDNACATGIITDTAYETMVYWLDQTGLIYDIHLIHSSNQIAPKVGEDGTIIPNGYVQYDNEFRNDDIYQMLFEGSSDTYYMKEGDYLRVIVESKTPPLGVRMWNAITFSSFDSHISVNAGNYVGNEVENKEVSR